MIYYSIIWYPRCCRMRLFVFTFAFPILPIYLYFWRECGASHDKEEGIRSVSREGITNTNTATVGQEFVFNFPTPHALSYSPVVMISTLSSEPVNVTISVPGIDYYEQTTTVRKEHAEIQLPMSSYLRQGSFVQDRTVIVRANADISVFGMASEGVKADGFLAIPSHGLGRKYIVATYGPSCGDFATEFSLSALEQDTMVRITNTDGHSTTITINAYESYQVHDSYNDLTGSIIEANKPIAVMAGSQLTGVPAGNGCNMLLEQLPPIDSFGHNFIMAPFKTRDAGYIYRVIASVKSNVTINTDGSSNVGSMELETGQVFEGDVSDSSLTLITSNQPVMVVQYIKGGGDQNGDTSMVIVPPTELYTGNVAFPVYHVSMHDHYRYYINVIGKCAYIPGVTLDGTMPHTDWETLSWDGICVSRAQVDPGTHSIGHIDPEATFAVIVYGFQAYFDDAFAYPAGFKLLAPNIFPATPQNIYKSTPSILTMLRESVVVECTGNALSAFLPMHVVAKPGDLHLIDESCRGTNHNKTHFLVKSDFDDCGTTMKVHDNSVVYTNELFFDEEVPSDMGVIRNSHRVVIECFMERYGASDDVILKRDNAGDAFELMLYRDETYTVPNIDPINVNLHDTLYFQVNFTAQQQIPIISIDTFSVTSEADPDSTEIYTFMKDGCLISRNAVMFDNTSRDPSILRFRCTLGDLNDLPGEVYVHCEVSLCNASDTSVKCGCKSDIQKRGGGRMRRASPTYMETLGPITISIQSETNVIIACTVVCLVVFVGTIMTIHKRRRPEEKIKQEKTKLLTISKVEFGGG